MLQGSQTWVRDILLKLDTRNAEFMNHKDILQSPQINTELTRTIQQFCTETLSTWKKDNKMIENMGKSA